MRTPLMRLLVLTEDWRDPPTIEAGESYENSDWSLSNRFYLCAGDSVTFCWYFSTLGIVRKKRYLFKWPKITLSFFYSYRFLRWWALPVDKKCDFSSFLWVWKHPWSRVNCHLLCSFPFIKDTGFRKLICSNRSYPPKCSRFFHMSWAFLLSFSYRFGGLCRLPSSGFMNMYMYKLVIHFFFTLIVLWAGNALAVLRCKPS